MATSKWCLSRQYQTCGGGALPACAAALHSPAHALASSAPASPPDTARKDVGTERCVDGPIHTTTPIKPPPNYQQLTTNHTPNNEQRASRLRKQQTSSSATDGWGTLRFATRPRVRTNRCQPTHHPTVRLQPPLLFHCLNGFLVQCRTFPILAQSTVARSHRGRRRTANAVAVVVGVHRVGRPATSTAVVACGATGASLLCERWRLPVLPVGVVAATAAPIPVSAVMMMTTLLSRFHNALSGGRGSTELALLFNVSATSHNHDTVHRGRSLTHGRTGTFHSCR